MLATEGSSMSEAWVGIKHGQEGFPVAYLENDAFRITRSTTYNIDTAHQAGPIEKLLDVASVTAGLVLLAAWFWLLLSGCRAPPLKPADAAAATVGATAATTAAAATTAISQIAFPANNYSPRPFEVLGTDDPPNT
jgi:hypothetical protein